MHDFCVGSLHPKGTATFLSRFTPNECGARKNQARVNSLLFSYLFIKQKPALTAGFLHTGAERYTGGSVSGVLFWCLGLA